MPQFPQVGSWEGEGVLCPKADMGSAWRPRTSGQLGGDLVGDGSEAWWGRLCCPLSALRQDEVQGPGRGALTGGWCSGSALGLGRQEAGGRASARLRQPGQKGLIVGAGQDCLRLHGIPAGLGQGQQEPRWWAEV